MKEQLLLVDKAAEKLTAPGAFFETGYVDIDGVSFNSYVNQAANLGSLYEYSLQYSDKTFLVYNEQRLSFLETYKKCQNFAAVLKNHYDIKKGDRVAIYMRNNPEWVIAFMGISYLGAVVVPMNSWWTSAEAEYAINDSGSVVVLADKQCFERVRSLSSESLHLIVLGGAEGNNNEMVSFESLMAEYADQEIAPFDVTPDDHATIFYTSGSTGEPKGVLSTHRNIISALSSWLLNIMVLMGDDIPEPPYPPSCLLTVPLFHVSGSHVLFLFSLLIGRKITMMYKWDANEALRLIERERVTFFNGVPTMSSELQQAAVNTDRDLSSLTDVFSGGAARPPAQINEILETFKGASTGNGYGLTETNGLGAAIAGDLYLALPDSVGRPIPAITEFKIVDEQGRTLDDNQVGEICIKSAGNAKGYWNLPDETGAAFVEGWFHTGDMGCLDKNGFLKIVDRIKDIIIRGGENISCLEVEAAIYTHPAVAEAAVIGVPDSRLGEVVGAALVLKPDCELTVDALTEHLKGRLADFKIPVQVWFMDEKLPKTASEKIFKKKLKETLFS